MSLVCSSSRKRGQWAYLNYELLPNFTMHVPPNLNNKQILQFVDDNPSSHAGNKQSKVKELNYNFGSFYL